MPAGRRIPGLEPAGNEAGSLSSLNGQLPQPGTTVTLALGTDGSASGSDGCNRYSTTYTVDGSTISFAQPAASTMMACTQPVMDQADAYMQALATANGYQMASNQLSLLDGNKVVATFVGETQGLAGTAWQVIAYNNGRQAVVSVINGTELTALFDENGQVTGNAGCNDYFASYKTGDSDIQIGPVGATRKACSSPPGIMEQESEYLVALQTAATYRVEGNNLEMPRQHRRHRRPVCATGGGQGACTGSGRADGPRGCACRGQRPFGAGHQLSNHRRRTLWH